jgi:hypothetical protein
MSASKPHAHTDQLLVEELADELLVYDQRDDTAHRLNRTAAVVWRNCDGTRDVAELAAVLADELGEVADEDLVTITLDDLADRGLVSGAPIRAAEARRNSRRKFIRRVGTVGAAALVLPVVRSIVAPEPAAAQSPCTCLCSCTVCSCSCECFCG